MYVNVDTSPMVSLSYRFPCPELGKGVMVWTTGEQYKETRVREVANKLAEQGCLSIHWEDM